MTRGLFREGEGLLSATTVREVFARFQEATGSRDIAELAAWLETPVNCLEKAAREGFVASDWLGTLVMKKSDYMPQWVLTGQGEKKWPTIMPDGM